MIGRSRYVDAMRAALAAEAGLSMHRPARLEFDCGAQVIDQVFDRRGTGMFPILGGEAAKRFRDARRRRRAARQARFQRHDGRQDQVLKGRNARIAIIDEFGFGFGHGFQSPVSDTAEPSAAPVSLND